MAKSKNHTTHTASQKAHKNGIKSAPRQRYTSTKGMDAKYLANLKKARAGNYKPKEVEAAK